MVGDKFAKRQGATRRQQAGVGSTNNSTKNNGIILSMYSDELRPMINATDNDNGQHQINNNNHNNLLFQNKKGQGKVGSTTSRPGTQLLMLSQMWQNIKSRTIAAASSTTTTTTTSSSSASIQTPTGGLSSPTSSTASLGAALGTSVAAMGRRDSKHRKKKRHDFFDDVTGKRQHQHQHRKQFQVNMPTKMLTILGLIFLVLPILIFCYKEVHIHDNHDEAHYKTEKYMHVNTQDVFSQISKSYTITATVENNDNNIHDNSINNKNDDNYGDDDNINNNNINSKNIMTQTNSTSTTSTTATIVVHTQKHSTTGTNLRGGIPSSEETSEVKHYDNYNDDDSNAGAGAGAGGTGAVVIGTIEDGNSDSGTILDTVQTQPSLTTTTSTNSNNNNYNYNYNVVTTGTISTATTMGTATTSSSSSTSKASSSTTTTTPGSINSKNSTTTYPSATKRNETTATHHHHLDQQSQMQLQSNDKTNFDYQSVDVLPSSTTTTTKVSPNDDIPNRNRQ